MWSYIAGGLKIKAIEHRKLPFGTKSSGLIIKGGLKIEDCKIDSSPRNSTHTTESAVNQVESTNYPLANRDHSLDPAL